MTGQGDEDRPTASEGRGWRVDPHVKVLNETVVSRAKARELDAIVYAPHFVRLPSIRHRASAFADDELAIVPGREIFAGPWHDRKHLLAIGLDEPIPDFISLDAAVAACREQDAAILVPHPAFATVSLGRDDVERYRDHVHAVETCNPKLLPHHNGTAKSIASDVDLPAFGSSYAHRPGTVGEVWTTFEPGSAFDAGDDLRAMDVEQATEAMVAVLADDGPRTVDRGSGVAHRGRCLAEFAHLGWENTWKKAARVLSGMEATHPRHAAYGGEYDDVAVY